MTVATPQSTTEVMHVDLLVPGGGMAELSAAGGRA
jgi:hypothetical protein